MRTSDTYVLDYPKYSDTNSNFFSRKHSFLSEKTECSVIYRESSKSLIHKISINTKSFTVVYSKLPWVTRKLYLCNENILTFFTRHGMKNGWNFARVIKIQFHTFFLLQCRIRRIVRCGYVLLVVIRMTGRPWLAVMTATRGIIGNYFMFNYNTNSPIKLAFYPELSRLSASIKLCLN